MGGAVSSGRDNNELIDNLMSGNYIRTRQVEAVFRALDRADYMTPEARDQAYKDLAWRNGPLHLSSPCIYSEVMEGLELRPGLSFLNVGSGTGYLSSLVGLILGTSGISHGVEVHSSVVEYATKKISQFIENSPTLDEFDFCEPKYFIGNALCLTPPLSGYDRVYCGAACPVEYEMYFKQLLKVGGLLVMPLNDTLLQVRRVGPEKWVSRSLLNVSFAPLRPPTAEESTQNAKLDPLRPVRLQLLSRAVVRRCMRGGVLRRHPELQQGPRFPPPAACPRRICIPIEPGGSVEGLNVLHDLDNESGANEMNALLSLVISMGQNRVAGALRFDRVDSDSSDDENEAEAPETDRSDAPENDRPDAPVTDRPGDPETDRPDAPVTDRPDAPVTDRLDTPVTDRPDAPETDRHNTSETDRANGGPDGLPDDRPKDIDLPVSDSEAKSNENMDSSGLGDTPSVLRRRPADGFEYRNGQIHANGTRRRPRPPGDSVDDKSAPGNAMRELVRKRREARPSTSTSQSSMFEALKNTEEMAKKETVVENEEKTDNMTGPPKRELPGVPSVVEIELGEASDMEWDPEYAEALEAAARRLADPDVGEDETLKNGPKRQKLDGGIAENGSVGKSPDGSKDKETDPERPEDGAAGGGAGGADSRSWSPGPEERAHTARRRRREARGGGARRVRLSLLMKQAVRELPLPHALKKFVNLGRCFEF